MAKLSHIDVGEVSLVDKAANKRKFLVLKNEGENDMPELILEVKKGTEDFHKSLAKAINDDDTLVSVIENVQKEDVRKSLTLVTEDDSVKAVVKAMEDDAVKSTLSEVVKSTMSMEVISAVAKSDDSIDVDVDIEIKKASDNDDKKKLPFAIKAALKALNTAKAELPKNVMDILSKVSGISKAVSNTLAGIKKNADGSADFSAIPEDMRATVEALWKSNEDANARAEKIEKTLDKERNERLNNAYIEKARSFEHLSMDADKFGPILKSISDKLSTDDFSELERVLKAASEGMEKLFKATGSDGGDDGDNGDDSAYSKLNKKAEEIAKRDSITGEQAFVKALNEYPDLAAQERVERAAKTKAS